MARTLLQAPLLALALLSSASFADDASLPSPAASLPAEDPADGLAALDARVAALPSLRYGVQRTTTRGEVRAVERWRFASRADGAFRVDYSGDTQRIVAFDGKILWDYIPAARAARRIRVADLTPAERERTLEAILSKVALPGLRTGVEAAGMTWTWTPSPPDAPAGTRLAVGTDPTGGRITFLLADTLDRILSSEVRREGRVVLTMDAAEHREVAPGVFFPTRIALSSPDTGGRLRVDIQVLQPVAGEPFPDSLFTLSLDASVHVDD